MQVDNRSNFFVENTYNTGTFTCTWGYLNFNLGLEPGFKLGSEPGFELGSEPVFRLGTEPGFQPGFELQWAFSAILNMICHIVNLVSLFVFLLL